MAQLTLTIPDTAVGRVADAFRNVYPDPGSQLTDAQFVKRRLLEFVKRTVSEHEGTGIREAGHMQTEEEVVANKNEIEGLGIV